MPIFNELGLLFGGPIARGCNKYSVNLFDLALVDEFNRQVNTTSFNGIRLLDNSVGNISIQACTGTNGTVQFSIGTSLQRKTGNGQFNASVTYGAYNTNPAIVISADINNDGNLDVITGQTSTNGIYIRLGNGDGSFSAATSYASGTQATGLAARDVNADGKIDIITATNAGKVLVYTGVGNGTLNAAVTYDYSGSAGLSSQLRMSDINGDSIQNIVVVETNRVYSFLGNSNGSFSIVSSFSAVAPVDLDLKDYNNDGIIDLAFTDYTNDNIAISFGNGNGTFRVAATYSTNAGASDPYLISSADLNGDGYIDIVAANFTTSSTSVFLNNGNGSFKAAVTYAQVGQMIDSQAIDVNGDGIPDIVAGSYGTVGVTGYLTVSIGDGDGTFKAMTSTAVTSGIGAGRMAIADFNKDGALDVVSASSDNIVNYFSGKTQNVTTIARMSLYTQEDARSALTVIQGIQERINLEIGNVGAQQSRLQSTMRTLQVTRENYLSAQSRILDVDVAESTAELTQLSIQQQVATAILGQANQEPSLVLKLLGG